MRREIKNTRGVCCVYKIAEKITCVGVSTYNIP